MAERLRVGHGREHWRDLHVRWFDEQVVVADLVRRHVSLQLGCDLGTELEPLSVAVSTKSRESSSGRALLQLGKLLGCDDRPRLDRHRRDLHTLARVKERHLVVEHSGEDRAEDDLPPAMLAGAKPLTFIDVTHSRTCSGRMSTIRMGPNSGMTCRYSTWL